jgi:hypothetical protein
MPCVASLGRVAPSVNMCGEVCRRLHRLKRPCGCMVWRSSCRAGYTARLEADGGRFFGAMSLRRGETSRWRTYVQEQFTAGCGGFDGEGSAKPRDRRLGVALWRRRRGCGETSVAAPLPESGGSVQTDTMTNNSLRSRYYLHTNTLVKNPYVKHI